MLYLHYPINTIKMQTRNIDNRKIIYKAGWSFKYDSDTQLATSLHCHAEYELVYIIGGYGKEFIGDSVREYEPGDMVLIGANLPHLYIAKASVAPKDNLCNIMQFPRNIFPEQMEFIPEYSTICTVLEKSAQGIVFHSKGVKREVLKTLQNLNKQQGINRLLSLFRILSTLGKTKEITLASSLKYSNPLNSYTPDDPVSKIYGYLINNHKNELKLTDIAGYMHMNPGSVCRYFKQKTGKTIFQCLNEIRIEYACKLLGNSNLNISQIAWESGFGNQAHFNKQFRHITKQTPTEYRNNLSL